MPNDVETTLNYAVPFDGEPLYKYIFSPPEGVPRKNFEFKAYPATVRDARGTEMEEKADLDVHGFQFVKHKSLETEFLDEDRIKEVYFKEAEQLLLSVIPWAKRVHVFDSTVRRKDKDPSDPTEGRGPALRVHADQTYESGPARLRIHLPDQADRLLKGRMQIINVWRPIGNPVAHNPLAVADWRSVNPAQDLLATKRIHPDFIGATYNVRHSEKHQWWHLADQSPEECLLIKCYDTVENVARATPHTSFDDHTSPPEAPHRQSIELRCFVFELD
ncbi:hypothetical protein MD484_g5334, partial [Candolleomyces efflorescens]